MCIYIRKDINYNSMGIARNKILNIFEYDNTTLGIIFYCSQAQPFVRRSLQASQYTHMHPEIEIFVSICECTGLFIVL